MWKGNTVSNFLIQRIPRQIQAVSVDGKEIMINFTNFKASGIRISAARIPVITISLTATVEAGTQNATSREVLRQSILDELQRQLREIQNAVVIEGGTDLFFVGRYARWAGNLDEIRLADSKFVIKLDLMDPKLLIRE